MTTGIEFPNLKVLSDWRSSLNVAFSTLRRIPFLTEPVFQMGDFNPQTNFNGMTVTNYRVYRARYLKIYKFLWFSFEITATLAAPFAANVMITIPGTGYDPEQTFAGQSGGAQIRNAGAYETGTWLLVGRTNVLQLNRPGWANFTAGASVFRANGFVEVQ